MPWPAIAFAILGICLFFFSTAMDLGALLSSFANATGATGMVLTADEIDRGLKFAGVACLSPLAFELLKSVASVFRNVLLIAGLAFAAWYFFLRAPGVL
ncbi:MAG: hypothetical protein ACI81R_002500 [Bradymonadia bacterium]|jgi:hypothetical protein